MRYVSATEAKQNFAAMIDAAQRGPVVIRRQSRDSAALISPPDYDRLRGVAVADFEAFCDEVAAKAAAPPPRAPATEFRHPHETPRAARG